MKYPLQVHVLKVFEGRFPVMETFGGRTYLEEASLGTFEIQTCSLLLFLPSLLLIYHGGLCHMLTLPPCSALTGAQNQQNQPLWTRGSTITSQNKLFSLRCFIRSDKIFVYAVHVRVGSLLSCTEL